MRDGAAFQLRGEEHGISAGKDQLYVIITSEGGMIGCCYFSRQTIDHSGANGRLSVYAEIADIALCIYQRQTRLEVSRKSGDLELEGEITGYALTPMAISADSYSAETKLTITVKVRFTNNVNPEESFDKTYSAYQTFESSQMLSDVQEELCNAMIKEIAENIYNDTVARW